MHNTTIAEVIDRNCNGITIGFIIGYSIYVIKLLIVVIFVCVQNWDLSRIRQGQHSMLARIKALENPVWHSVQGGERDALTLQIDRERQMDLVT